MTLYGPLYTVAAVIGFAWFFFRFRRAGYRWPMIFHLSAVMAWSAIACTYLFHSLLSFFPDLFPPGLITKHFGSSTIMGLIIGGSLGGALFCRLHHLPLGRLFDLGILPFPLSQAIGRMGCFSAGCCFGKPTSCPLAMSLPGLHGQVAPRWPTQLISAGANLAILGILLSIEHFRRRRKDDEWPFAGFLYLFWVCLYSTKRFLVEFIRGTAMPVLWGLTWAQALSAIAFAAAATAIAVNMRRRTSTRTGA